MATYRRDTESLLLHSQGDFWALQNRLRKGGEQPIWAVSCSELGVELDRLLAPAYPQLLTQNGGAQCEEVVQYVALHPKVPHDIVVLVHEPCLFSGGRSLEDQLRRQFETLCESPLLCDGFQTGQTRVHLWGLDRYRNLKVFRPAQGRSVSPLQPIDA